MTKVHAKAAAIELRRAGHTYSHIVDKVGVSKGTLAVWLAEVPYAPNAETLERIGKARAASGAAKSRLKLESIQKARTQARAEIGKISKRDIFMLGLGLYIGEGTKSILQTVFVNSNPTIIRFMVRWFIEAVGLRKDNLRMRIHAYPDCDIAESIRYWSRIAELPESQFLKTVIDWRKDKK